MDRELCLMRGVDDGCLVSMTTASNGRCVLRFSAEQPSHSISVPMPALEAIAIGGSVCFASEQSMCRFERERDVMRIRYIGLERRSRSYEIEATRFETALIMLSARTNEMNLASLN